MSRWQRLEIRWPHVRRTKWWVSVWIGFGFVWHARTPPSWAQKRDGE